jgi:hypothetical protein
MSMDERRHDELAELALLAPLGALLPEEQRAVAEHAQSCARCSAELAKGSAATHVLALAAPTLAPSSAARESLLSSLEGAPQRRESLRLAPPRRKRGLRLRHLAASAAVLALALATVSLVAVLRQERETRRALQLADARTEERFASEAQRLEALAQRLGSFEQALAAGESGNTRSFALAGEASFGEAKARVVMDAAGEQVLLLASRLPPLPPGRTYQLWVIVSGAPRSLGVFAPDREGRVVYVQSEPLELGSGLQAAVSVEPEGGVPQPTGPIVLVSH